MNFVDGKIVLKSKKLLAFDSPDHLAPFGTRKDNTKNRIFNHKLYNLWGDHRPLKILDLGCSGGGFVKDCIDDGNLAIGLEGSDYSKKIKRAEWRTIPDFLFTCDITEDFSLFLKKRNKENKLLFDVITMWDVIEHIAEKDLEKVIKNIKNSFGKEGILILSINCRKDTNNGIRLHQTVKSKKWWIRKFKEWGFIILPKYHNYFRNQWLRNYPSKKGGFNIVLTLKENHPPKVPRQNILKNIFNRWVGSKPQIIIKKILFGYTK